MRNLFEIRYLRNLLLLASFVFSSLLFPLDAISATLTVDKDGGQDYTSIQAAVNAASSGDTIVVYEGAAPYYEEVRIETGNLTIEAATGESPIIDAQNTRRGCFFVNQADYVTIDGFICRNSLLGGTYPYEFGGQITFRGSHYGTVKNCEVYGGPSTPDDRADIFFQGGNNYATIENNYLHSSGIYANLDVYGEYSTIRGNEITGGRSGIVTKWGGTGASNHLIENNYIHDLATTGTPRIAVMYLRDGTNIIVRNNVIYNCPSQNQGIFLYDSANNGYPDEYHEVYNNTIDNGSGSGGAIKLERVSYSKVKNNIIINGGRVVGFNDWAGGPTTGQRSVGNSFDYNLYYNNSEFCDDGASAGDTCEDIDGGNNITSDPNINASGNRPSPYYYLQLTSNAIGAGDPTLTVDQAGTVDYFGNSRLAGQIDIGAFEFPLGPPAPVKNLRMVN